MSFCIFCFFKVGVNSVGFCKYDFHLFCWKFVQWFTSFKIYLKWINYFSAHNYTFFVFSWKKGIVLCKVRKKVREGLHRKNLEVLFSYRQVRLFLKSVQTIFLDVFLTLFFFLFFFLIATRRTLLYKTRRTLLTIPPTRRYLFYLLYNTSLDCNSYPTFYSFFFFAYTPMYLLNYNSKWVSI